jgi:hypothetical protein
VPAGGVFSAGGKVTVKGASTLTGGSAEGKTDFVFGRRPRPKRKRS